MSESRAAGWPSEAPTAAQLKEFFAQIESGRITKERLQLFMRPKPGQYEMIKHELIALINTRFFLAYEDDEINQQIAQRSAELDALVPMDRTDDPDAN